MKTITVDGKEYKLEFGFDAVEVGDLVQKMFEVKSGLYVARSAQEGNNIAVAMLDGTSERWLFFTDLCNHMFLFFLQFFSEFPFFSLCIANFLTVAQ